MKFALAVAFTTIVLSGSAQAQETPPWPPDPAEIFAPGVEILEVEVPYPSQPMLDNEARVVRGFDTESRQQFEFAYPSEISEFNGVQTFSSHTLILSILNEISYGNVEREYWLLDTRTGEFSRRDVVCGQPRTLPSEGRWVAYADNSNTVPDLCNTETGERISVPLEVGRLTGSNGLTRTAVVSPDGRRAVVLVYGGVEVYTFATGGWLHLGETIADEIRTATWLGNERVLISDTMTPDGYPPVNFSLGSASHGDSLYQVTQAIKPDWISRLENPSRFEWIDYREEGCFLTQIYVDDGHKTGHWLDDLCQLGVPLTSESDRLYSPIEVSSRIGKSRYVYPIGRSLIRFNPYTGERHELLEDEIERVLDISPDSHYAVLVLDNNGQLDFLDSDSYSYYVREDRTANYRLAIIELDSGEIVYDRFVGEVPQYDGFPLFPSFDSRTGSIIDNFIGSVYSAPKATMHSIGGQRFLMHWDREARPVLIDIGGGQVTETPVDRVVAVLGDAERLITVTPYIPDSGRDVRIYDIANQEYRMIMQNVRVGQLSGSGRYVVNFAGGETADMVEVTVNEIDQSQAYTGNKIRYTIRLA